MAERKFTLGLNKPGMAAQLRETVSQVVRESAVLVSFFFFSFSFVFVCRVCFFFLMFLLSPHARIQNRF